MKDLSTMTIALFLLSGALPAVAQDSQTGATSTEKAVTLPAICKAEAGAHDGMAMSGGTDMSSDGMSSQDMDAGHQALAASTAGTHETMMAAMSADDVDVAFVCGMIPHHQGAIAMARAELEHGDDAWAKSLAQQIIDAQEKEIGEMLAWLDKQK